MIREGDMSDQEMVEQLEWYGFIDDEGSILFDIHKFDIDCIIKEFDDFENIEKDFDDFSDY
jgi:hypothetical protein